MAPPLPAATHLPLARLAMLPCRPPSLPQPAPMRRSVLDDLGEEVTGIVSPVSICMALTVALVRILNPGEPGQPLHCALSHPCLGSWPAHSAGLARGQKLLHDACNRHRRLCTTPCWATRHPVLILFCSRGREQLGRRLPGVRVLQ